MRDVGAAALGLGLIAVAALVRDEAILLGVAGAANLVFGLPHAIHHVRHLDVYESSTDKVMSAGGLVFTTACAGFLLFAAYQRVNESPRRA